MVAIDDEWSKLRLLSERFTIYPLFSKAGYLPFNFPINCLKAGKNSSNSGLSLSRSMTSLKSFKPVTNSIKSALLANLF